MPSKQIRTKNGNDYLYWVVYFINDEGKRSSKSFANKVDALRFENGKRKLGRNKVKKIAAKRGVTFENLVEAYRSASIIGREGRTPWARNTLKRFDADMTLLRKNFDFDKRAAELTVSVSRNLRDHLVENLNRTTAGALFSQYKAILTFAVMSEKILVNGAHGLTVRMDKLRQKKAVLDIHSPAEVRKLVVAAEVAGGRYGFLPRLLHETGMRISEIRALEWNRVDLENRVITVCGAVDQDLREASDVKSVNSFRKIRFSAELRDKLIGVREATDSRWLLSESGLIHSYRNLLRAYKRQQDLAGVPARGFHAARHFCASRMIAGGCSELVLRKHLGHDSIETTLRVYGHLFDERQALNDTPDNLGTF